MKELFKKPNWLKPEINQVKYHLHLVILVFVILFGLDKLFGHNMFTLMWGAKMYILLLASDIFAHTGLQLD